MSSQQKYVTALNVMQENCKTICLKHLKNIFERRLDQLTPLQDIWERKSWSFSQMKEILKEILFLVTRILTSIPMKILLALNSLRLHNFPRLVQ